MGVIVAEVRFGEYVQNQEKIIMESKARPRAVITGASSGIGAAFADRLARDQWDLVIIGRRGERLESLARRLRQNYKITMETMIADLAATSDLQAVEQRLSEDTTVELLVNNAGFGVLEPFVEIDVDRAEELVRVQVLAVTRLTRALLPGMIRRGTGSIINVSSRLALSAGLPSPPLPNRTIYAATKAYINTFTQLLHSELAGTGVQVQALCPGLVRTEFFERMGMDPVSFPAAMMMKPRDVVKASLAGLRLGEVICIPSLDDPGILIEIEEAQRRVFDHSHSDAVAERYS